MVKIIAWLIILAVLAGIGCIFGSFLIASKVMAITIGIIGGLLLAASITIIFFCLLLAGVL
ncbi:MAG: hypothetical protein Q8O83_02955 [bacterium]|nr:hypothetical protein [bacterium]